MEDKTQDKDSKAVIYSYKIDQSGVSAAVEPAGTTSGGMMWIHLNGKSTDAKKFLKENLQLDPLVAKSLLAEETRPRFEEFGDNALVILRGILFNPGPDPEDLVSIRVWVSPNLVLTIGRRKSKAIADINDRLAQQRGPKKPGEFIAQLINSLHDGIEPAIRELDEMTDDLEEQSLDHPEANLRGDIAGIRKQAILFRRHMAPQRDVIYRLHHAQQNWLSEGDKWYLQDNLDRITRFIENLDAIRERTQIVQDELNSALTARLNKNIYLLSMITVIFMPLSFLTGLLGINVDGIPGAEHPMAFTVFSLLLALVVIIELLIFKRLKWF